MFEDTIFCSYVYPTFLFSCVLILNLDKRLRKLEFAFTPQGLAKGLESVLRRQIEQVSGKKEIP